jgi:hypothetical protein
MVVSTVVCTAVKSVVIVVLTVVDIVVMDVWTAVAAVLTVVCIVVIVVLSVSTTPSIVPASMDVSKPERASGLSVLVTSGLSAV